MFVGLAIDWVGTKMIRMAKKKNDRHLSSTHVRVKPVLVPVSKLVASDNAQSLTEFVNEAIRNELQRRGFWPITDEIRSRLEASDN